jgi:hypothetical protein
VLAAAAASTVNADATSGCTAPLPLLLCAATAAEPLAPVHLQVAGALAAHMYNSVQPQPPLAVDAELIRGTATVRVVPGVIQLYCALGRDLYPPLAAACRGRTKQPGRKETSLEVPGALQVSGLCPWARPVQALGCGLKGSWTAGDGHQPEELGCSSRMMPQSPRLPQGKLSPAQPTTALLWKHLA